MLIDGPYFYNASGTGSFTGSFAGDGSELTNLPWNELTGIPTGLVSSSLQVSSHPLLNGASIDSPYVSVSSDGSTVSLSLEKSGSGDIQFIFSDGVHTHDTTPAETITLLTGSDASPQLNYIYILQSDKTLYTSPSGWPSTEHARIATAVVQSAASAQTDGIYKLHAWTDHISNIKNGHLIHINEWIRSQPATWTSGVAFTWGITSSTIDFSSTAGVVLQLHDHSFPSFDTSTGSEVMVINRFGNSYARTSNLETLIDEDSNGNTIANNKYISIVIWGVISEHFEDCQLIVNLPSAEYDIASDALNDSENYSNYSIPSSYLGTGFLISRLVLKKTPSGFDSVTGGEFDLRGLLPFNASGGASTSYVTEFSDNSFSIYDESDVTKKLAFQVSSITTGTTRTATIQNSDGTIAYLSDVNTVSSSLASRVSVVETLTPNQILFGASDGGINQSSYHSINGENLNSEVVKVGRQLVITGSIAQYSNSTTYSPRVIYNPTSLYLNGSYFGVIVLKFPQSWTNTMLVFKLDGFEYGGNRSNWSATISGYNYTGPYWTTYSARIDGPAPFNRIRLGHDGKNCILILGNTSTKWISTKIILSHVIASHYNNEKWIPSGSLTSEYNFYLTGSTSGFSSIVEPTIYQYQSSASGYFGYGTTNPQSKIHVDSGDIRVTNGGLYSTGIVSSSIGFYGYGGSWIQGDSTITGSLILKGSVTNQNIVTLKDRTNNILGYFQENGDAGQITLGYAGISATKPRLILNGGVSNSRSSIYGYHNSNIGFQFVSDQTYLNFVTGSFKTYSNLYVLGNSYLTGSLDVVGIISSSAFYGDGSNITNIPSSSISGLDTYIENTSFAYQKAQFVTCSYEDAGVTYDWDMVDKPILKLNLTASLTFNNPTNKRSIQSGIIHVLQGGSGGHTLAFSSDFKGRNDASIPSIITTALSASSIFYYTDGTYVYLSS